MYNVYTYIMPKSQLALLLRMKKIRNNWDNIASIAAAQMLSTPSPPPTPSPLSSRSTPPLSCPPPQYTLPPLV